MQSPWPWMRRSTAWLLPSLTLLLAACPDNTPSGDAGVEDGGKGGDDDGGAPDAGQPTEDAGAPDAGPNGGDGGAPDGGAPGDAGEPPSDGGNADVDGGPTDDGGLTDAGAVDAGPTLDPTSGYWSGDFVLPGALGFGARVTSAAVAPNGAVYIAGNFTTVNGERASNIAVWTGNAFLPVGEGVPGYVYAMAVAPNGDVYVGGDVVESFDQPERLMKWDGSQWTTLPGDIAGQVHALHAFEDGTLLVGGDFTSAGDATFQGLALYSATGYADYFGATVDGEVKVIYDDATLGLCIGGNFRDVAGVAAANIACHDGSTWGPVGRGVNGEVLAMARDGNGDFIIGGGFAFPDPNNPENFWVGLGRLDQGALVPHAGGVGGGGITSVRALLPLPDNRMIVGGCFAGAGDGANAIASSNMAILTNGTSWSPPDQDGSVVGPLGIFLPGVEGVYTAVPMSDGSVLVGGYFTDAGGVVSGNVVVWDGSAFAGAAATDKSFLGVNGVVNVLERDRANGFYLGGYFDFAGTVRVNNIARYTPAGYEALGEGLDGNVRAILPLSDGSVLVGGDFYAPVGADAPIPFLARWTGSSWVPVVGNVNGPVNAIALDDDGAVLIGGDFTEAGGVVVNHIARISNLGVQPFDEGFTDGDENDLFRTRVTSITVDAEGAVIAGGILRASGTTPIPAIARHDGSGWQSIGTGVDDPNGGYVSTLGWYQADLIVGGNFDQIGGVAAKGIARWDGAEYSMLGGGVAGGFTTLVSGVDVWGNYLFATGLFTAVGSDQQSASYIAVFDGSDWAALGQGLGDLGEAVLVYDNSLIVGGGFVEANGVPSVGLARWVFNQD